MKNKVTCKIVSWMIVFVLFVTSVQIPAMNGIAADEAGSVSETMPSEALTEAQEIPVSEEIPETDAVNVPEQIPEEIDSPETETTGQSETISENEDVSESEEIYEDMSETDDMAETDALEENLSTDAPEEFVMGDEFYENAVLEMETEEDPGEQEMNTVSAESWMSFYSAVSEMTKENEEISICASGRSASSLFETARLIIKMKKGEPFFELYQPVKLIKGPEHYYVAQFETAEQAEMAAAYLSFEEDVSYAEADGLMHINEESGTEMVASGDAGIFTGAGEHMSWGISHIGADNYASYAKTVSSGSIVVAVVDSGVNASHPYLAGRIAGGGYDFVDNDSDPEDENIYDKYGNYTETYHGTHVAGTVADCTLGLNVSVLPVRVMNQRGSGSDSNIANGIRYAADKGAKVINLSLGGAGCSEYVEEAVAYAIKKGVSVIVAAGNENVDTSDCCPAHIADAVTVAAVDETETKAYFSNYGQAVDVAAPGVNILSCQSGNRYQYMNGTSMATPHVSGLAAMIKLVNPSYSPAQIESTLKGACRDLGNSGWDMYYGYGIPDLNCLIPQKPDRLDTPSITEIVNVDGGVQISWNAVANAQGYYIKRGTSSGSYNTVLLASGTSYLDGDVTDGVTYYYTVAAYCDELTSEYSSERSITRRGKLGKPAITGISNSAGGISINWSSVANAQGYYVYRKVEGGSYSRIASTSSCTYKDLNVKNGTTYYYRVCAYNESGTGPDSDERGIRCLVSLGTPSISTIVNTGSGIRLVWSDISYAAGYRVYRRADNESDYQQIATVSTNEYVDTNTVTGRTYSYMISAYSGSIVSEPASAKSILCIRSLGTPTVSNIENTPSGVRLTWGRIPYASTYCIYRRLDSETVFKKLQITTETEFVDTSAVAGETYRYTISACNGNIESASAAGKTILCVKRIDAVKPLTCSNSSSGVKLSWKKVANANGYNVYRRLSTESVYTRIAFVTGAGYLDSAAVNGRTYYYKVTAYNGSVESTTADEKLIVCVKNLEKPSISSISNSPGGVKMSWNAVPNASGYHVYRRLSTESAFTKIATVTGTGYVDGSAAAGKNYRYTVTAYNGSVESAYAAGKDIVCVKSLEKLSISSISNSPSGVKLSWNAVSNVSGYYVYRKLSTESTFTKIAAVTGSGYVDGSAAAGKNYRYTVTAYNGSVESAYAEGRNIFCVKSLEKLSISSISNSPSGVKLSWNAASNASGYHVYRRLSTESTFTMIATVTGNGYVDGNAAAGKNYRYTVTAYNGSVESAYAEGRNIFCVKSLEKPSISSISNSPSGVKLSWNAVSNASGYYVYRKLSTESTFKKVATVTGTGYVDGSAAAGKNYRYTVTAYNGSVESAYAAGKDIFCAKSLGKPSISSIGNSPSGVKLSWNAVPNASGYHVFRRLSTESTFTKIATVTGSGYVDGSAAAGKNYRYTVTAYNGSVESAYAEGRNIFCVRSLGKPSISSISNSPSGVKLSWNAVSNASGYYVYRRLSTESTFTKVATVTGSGYVDGSAAAGKNYRYTVTAYNGTVESAYAEGKNIFCVKSLGKPSINSISNSPSGVKLSWNAVSNTSGYHIYRRLSTESTFTKVATVTGSGYVDGSAAAGKNYRYTVTAYNGSVESAYAEGRNIFCVRSLGKPTISSISNSPSGVKLSWNAVSNASGYYVYRRLSTESMFTKVATVTGSGYVDGSAAAGKNYRYTVTAYNGSVESAYATGKDIFCVKSLGKPSISSISNSPSGVKLSWSTVSNAGGYAVYRRRTTENTFTKIASVSGTSYIDRDAQNGLGYLYMIGAYNGSVSGDNSVGRSIICVKTLDKTAISGITNTTGGVRLTWNMVVNADLYCVYRKLSTDTAYKKLGTVSGNSYLDNNTTGGKTYSYYVTACNDSVESASSTGKTITCVRSLDKVKIDKMINTVSGIRLSWGTVKGADTYCVYRRLSTESSYSKIAVVKTANYMDTSAVHGKSYRYTVSAVNGSVEGETASAFTIQCVKKLDKPVINNISRTTGGVRISWNTVTNAEQYCVYRRLSSDSTYTKVAVVSGNSYLDSGVSSGKSYRYTVTACNGNIEGASADGKTIQL